MKLSDLAPRISATVLGDPSLDITSCNTLADATPGQLSFLANPKYTRELETTKASAVIVGLSATTDRKTTLLKANDPYFSFQQAILYLHGHRKHPHAGVHPRAHVELSATVGEGSVIYPGVYLGPNVKVGRDCILYPNVTVYANCVLGDRVIIHAGTVIGEDGFGFATHKSEHHKIPTLGNVVIEDDVEIGANCTIDSATFGSTVIGKGTKFSNLIAIGHNSRVGPHSLLVAQVGIAGSVQIGHHATLAGQVGIAGHLKLGDNVVVAAQSGVMNDVPDQTVVMGSPAMPANQARRVYTLFTQLPDLHDRLKHLESAVSELGADPTPSDDLPS